MSVERAILFVDLADSVPLFERLGDRAAAAFVQRLLDRLRAAVAGAGGRVVKSLGDGVLATFAEPAACLAAAEAALGLAEPPSAGIRAAIHLGPVVAGSDDVFGDAVNLTARIEARARPGEILASEAFVRALPAALAARARPLAEVLVKGRTGPVPLWRIEPAAAAEATLLGLPAAAPRATRRLVLRHGDRELALARGGRAVLGRDPGCDLVVAAAVCSRRHAIVTHLGDRFGLEDCSTNGTFLVPDGGEPVLVRRETVTFGGCGRLGLGAPVAEDVGQIVRVRAEPG